MLENYLKIGLRTLRRYKGYTFINVVGLAVGMAVCVLILLYVQDELSYDRYHDHADRLYRVTHEKLDQNGNSSVHGVLTDPAVAPLLKAEFPEVIRAARLTPVGPLLSYEDRHIESGHCYWADPDLFDIFSMPLVAGRPETALVEPFSLVLSTSKARTLFGDEDPLGKTVVVNNNEAFTVTGVFEDLPNNTHLPIDVLGSMLTLERWFGKTLDHWNSPNYATYLRLAEGASPRQLAQKLPRLLEDYQGPEASRLNRLHLQPLTDIHLRSHLVMELAPNGDIRYVYLFSAVALFILLIACINFMNLATARSARRAKEVGMRKAVGARRTELIRQFLGESVLLAFLGLVLAVVLVELTLPFFNNFTGKDLGFRTEEFLLYLTIFASIGLLVGVLSGSYPAFYLSAFRPAAVLKGELRQGSRRSLVRSTLVVAQFAIAIVLMIGTLVVYRQLSFVQNQKLGLDKEHVLILPAIREIATDFTPFREQLLRNPDIVNVSQSNPVPSRRLTLTAEASTQHGTDNTISTASLLGAWIDEHFFPTYGVEFAAGRNFSDEFASDTDTGFILNETAAAQLGWASPGEAVDQPLRFGGWQGSVIGVVKDFHFESLHQQIAPMIFYMEPLNYRQVSVKIRVGSDLSGLIDFLETQWQRYDPNYPLSYSFLDERFGAVYEAERKLGQIFGFFALLAVFITCLGLFGMAAFTAEQRTKEIGVRKVLGASVSDIVLLLSREFSVLVLLAFTVAAPLAYFSMEQWLEKFAYHTALSWWVFALVGLTALVIALLTVSYQSIKAALTNPVKVLRYE